MDPAAPRFSSLLLDARVRGRKGTICFLGIAKLGKNISIPDRLLFKKIVKGLAHLGGIHGATAFAGNLASLVFLLQGEGCVPPSAGGFAALPANVTERWPCGTKSVSPA